MFSSANSKRALLALGLAGLIGALSTTTASAGFHFGGGHFSMPHFSAPRMSAPRISMGRISAPRFHAPRIAASRFGGFHQRQFGGLVRPVSRHTAELHNHGPRFPHEPRIKIGDHRSGCRHRGCWGPTPVAMDEPSYEAPATPIYEAPVTPVRPIYEAPVSRAPVVAPPVAEKAPVAPANTCVAGGTFLTIGFKPNVSVAAVAAFLKEYDIVIADGPNADGAFRVRLSTETVSLDKFGPMIESMKTKEIIATIAG